MQIGRLTVFIGYNRFDVVRVRKSGFYKIASVISTVNNKKILQKAQFKKYIYICATGNGTVRFWSTEVLLH